MLPWIYLALASLFEIGWVLGLKFTEGFTRPWPSVFTVFGMIASVACLALAVRTMPLGTAYAIWTGFGTIGAVLIGILLFAESASPARIACIAVIVVGIVGLKVTGD
jgi:quaternary ammonium compound-resistance protein SugE